MDVAGRGERWTAIHHLLEFQQANFLHLRTKIDAMRLNLEISGMHCEHCVESVRRALTGLPGLSECQVDVGRAAVVIDETKCFKADVFAAVRAAGAFDVAGFSTGEQHNDPQLR